jgi:hypothetical protein
MKLIPLEVASRIKKSAELWRNSPSAKLFSSIGTYTCKRLIMEYLANQEGYTFYSEMVTKEEPPKSLKDIYVDIIRTDQIDGLYDYSWATWIFDRIGRCPDESTFQYMTVAEYNKLKEKMKAIHGALCEVLGEESGSKTYKDWEEGRHDT